MATKRIFVVFVLPVIFSIIFGSVVMVDILQKPDRELNMWPISFSEEFSSYSTPIEITGISKQYSISEYMEIQVKIDDPSFDCGNLYASIYSAENDDDVITQDRFSDQCFEKEGKIFPVGNEFSKVIDSSDSYEVIIEMISKELMGTSTEGVFTVK